jgi:hypothetical protein
VQLLVLIDKASRQLKRGLTMQLMAKKRAIRVFSVLIIAVLGLAFSATLVKAQDGSQVTVTGTVQAINPDGSIVVDGVTYKLGAGVSIPATVQVGVSITLTGQRASDDTIVVIAISSPNAGTPAATDQAPTAVPLPDGNVIVVIEGPVLKININIITIYDFDIVVIPNHPILKIIKIGDVVRVRDAFGGNGIVMATLVSNVLTPSGASTVSLEGPIQALNGNVVVINGISAKLKDDDIKIKKVKVGDILRLDGNFEDDVQRSF